MPNEPMSFLPEFIPLAKQKEMFAVSSWRESPQVTPAAAATAAALPTLPSPATLPAAQCERDNNNPPGKSHRSRRGRGRAKTSAAQRQQDADDYFVNCVLPPGVSFATLKSELLLLSTTPLRAYDIGSPHTLFPRRNGGSAGAAAETGNADNGSVAAANTSTATPPPPQQQQQQQQTTTSNATSTAETPTGASAAQGRKKLKPNTVEPSPFRTPMVSAGMTAGDDYESPGASLPDLSLPPSVPSEILLKGHLISILFAESNEAEKVAEMLLKKWPQATVAIVSRNRSVLNTSLVLKGLPSLAKTERIIEELEKVIPQKPSYIRLHRGERGVFKNVVFVKYHNREIAEESKLRLERFIIGSRPLKVEFKKKEKASTERERIAILQQLVRNLRVSTEHEGFIYQLVDISKDELKALKQLCHSYDLSFELGEHSVTVRRILPGSGRPSPALRPGAAQQSSLSTVNFTQPTPASLRPMGFKGISHWREIRNNAVRLGIARPKGPGDVPPFAPGRGRPL
ncbi:uncharacterized protein TM35_000151540 [Trypanosoma theileri]|uniref:RNA-binding protein 38 n=1 Tax=Trypanosoma theileri TaxID=67003 RepID=A0A1X0NW66_9TRYP|nr:uncharacterized protein TM35_000151540 [Trypanosoma theileri]ORC88723.1 hypothetical protein TM35_000151540 [Trypanosoma theileri]